MINDGLLRVVHLHKTDAGGGAETIAYLGHQELLRRGHDSRMLVGRKTTDDPSVQELPFARGVPGLKRLTLKLEAWLGYQDLYNPRFRSIPRLIPPSTDVIHLHGLYPGGCFSDAGALPRLSRRWPFVLSLHDMTVFTGHCGQSTGCERWRRGCGRCPDLGLPFAINRDGTRLNWLRKCWYLRRSDIQVAACSRWLADRASQSPMFAGRTIRVLHNAVDTSVFCPAPREDARRSLELDDGAFVVGFVANGLQSRWKGGADAITALNAAATIVPLTALLVGSGQGMPAHLDVPHRLTGYIKDRSRLADAYRAADVLLMPSTEESFGMVAAEAMACGTPVVAYATGGLPEVIGEADECGILVAKHDVAGLTHALVALASDPERRHRMGTSASLRAQSRFSVERYMTTLLGIYRHAIEARRPRSPSS